MRTLPPKGLVRMVKEALARKGSPTQKAHAAIKAAWKWELGVMEEEVIHHKALALPWGHGDIGVSTITTYPGYVHMRTLHAREKFRKSFVKRLQEEGHTVTAVVTVTNSKKWGPYLKVRVVQKRKKSYYPPIQRSRRKKAA